MTEYDAPNQQVVRADGSGPGDEGTGGASDSSSSPGSDYDAMTKAQLLDVAGELELDVTAANTKDEIRAAIDEHEAA